MGKKKSKRNRIIEIDQTPMMCGRDIGNSTKIRLGSSGKYRKTRGVSMTRCAYDGSPNLNVSMDKFRAMSTYGEGMKMLARAASKAAILCYW